MTLFGTLYARLAAAFLVLVCLIGAGFFYVVKISAQMYQQEANQRLNAALARGIVAEEIVLAQREVNRPALERIFHMLMVINPSIEVYLLDTEGSILAYSADPGRVKRERVALAPIRRFLAGAAYPILGDDPRSPEGRKVFSVATVPASGVTEGYLYVILGGESFDSVAEMLGASYVMRVTLAGTAAGLAMAGLAGVLVLALLTRGVTRLARVVADYTRGGTGEATAAGGAARYPAPSAAGDEIDRLGVGFNAMADRMDRQVNELIQMDSARRELVANVSHDLRTPLAALQGYLETLLLKNRTLSAEQKRHYLEAAAGNCARLGSLIDELFELARLDAAGRLPNREPFPIGELLQDVVQKFAPAAEERCIRITTDFGATVPFAVGDIGLMQRVLENLIENALRHTPEGGQVRLSLAPGAGTVTVRIADTGCGIAAEDLPRIFERFYRARGAAQAPGSHAGLGLAITKRILELHGGHIDVDSALGRGTTFTFDIPAHQGV